MDHDAQNDRTNMSSMNPPHEGEVEPRRHPRSIGASNRVRTNDLEPTYRRSSSVDHIQLHPSEDENSDAEDKKLYDDSFSDEDIRPAKSEAESLISDDCSECGAEQAKASDYSLSFFYDTISTSGSRLPVPTGVQGLNLSDIESTSTRGSDTYDEVSGCTSESRPISDAESYDVNAFEAEQANIERFFGDGEPLAVSAPRIYSTIIEESEDDYSPIIIGTKPQFSKCKMGQYYSNPAHNRDQIEPTEQQPLENQANDSHTPLAEPETWRLSRTSSNTVGSSTTAESDDILAQNVSDLSSINSELSEVIANGINPVSNLKPAMVPKPDTSPEVAMSKDPDATPVVSPILPRKQGPSIADAINELESIEQAAQSLLCKRPFVRENFRYFNQLSPPNTPSPPSNSPYTTIKPNIIDGSRSPNVLASPVISKKDLSQQKDDAEKISLTSPTSSAEESPEQKKTYWLKSKEVRPFISRDSYNEDLGSKDIHTSKENYKESDLNDFLDQLGTTTVEESDGELLEKLLVDIQTDLNNTKNNQPEAKEDLKSSQESLTSLSRSRPSSRTRKFDSFKERVKDILKIRRKEKGLHSNQSSFDDSFQDDNSITKQTEDNKQKKPKVRRSHSFGSIGFGRRPSGPDIETQTFRSQTPDEGKKGFSNFFKSPKFLRKSFKRKSQSKPELAQTRNDTSDERKLQSSLKSLSEAPETKKEVRFHERQNEATSCFTNGTHNKEIEDTESVDGNVIDNISDIIHVSPPPSIEGEDDILLGVNNSSGVPTETMSNNIQSDMKVTDVSFNELAMDIKISRPDFQHLRDNDPFPNPAETVEDYTTINHPSVYDSQQYTEISNARLMASLNDAICMSLPLPVIQEAPSEDYSTPHTPSDTKSFISPDVSIRVSDFETNRDSIYDQINPIPECVELDDVVHKSIQEPTNVLEEIVNIHEETPSVNQLINHFEKTLPELPDGFDHEEVNQYVSSNANHVNLYAASVPSDKRLSLNTIVNQMTEMCEMAEQESQECEKSLGHPTEFQDRSNVSHINLDSLSTLTDEMVRITEDMQRDLDNMETATKQPRPPLTTPSFQFSKRPQNASDIAADEWVSTPTALLKGNPVSGPAVAFTCVYQPAGNVSANTTAAAAPINTPPIPPRQFQQKMPLNVVNELKCVLNDCEQMQPPRPLPKTANVTLYDTALHEAGLDRSTLLNEIEELLSFDVTALPDLSSGGLVDNQPVPDTPEMKLPPPPTLNTFQAAPKSVSPNVPRRYQSPYKPPSIEKSHAKLPVEPPKERESPPKRPELPVIFQFMGSPVCEEPPPRPTYPDSELPPLSPVSPGQMHLPTNGSLETEEYTDASVTEHRSSSRDETRTKRFQELKSKFAVPIRPLPPGGLKAISTPSSFQSPATNSPEKKTGVWTPGHGAPSGGPAKIETPELPSFKDVPPVWLPGRAESASPGLDKREYRKIQFDGPTVPKRNMQESKNAPGPEESFAWKGRQNLESSGIHLPMVQSPTVTLLQKKREGQIPDNRPDYIRADEAPFYKPGEKIYTIKKEYESEDEEHGHRKFAVLAPRQIDGVGPTLKDGTPVTLKSGVKSEHQGEWYKRMFDSLHKVKDGAASSKYKRSQVRYGGYMSEPEGGYDSDAGVTRYGTYDRTKNEFEFEASDSSTTRNTKRYVHQPGRIEDYVPGFSSLSERELKENPEADVKLEIATHSSGRPSQQRFQGARRIEGVKQSGYESDSTLVFRKREDTRRKIADPRVTREVYKEIQRGGEIPLEGLQKPAPRPTATGNHKYNTSEVNIHYRTPIRVERKEHVTDEELARRQEEHMQKVYEQERRKKYLSELEDIERRRHTDNFTPLQKSPIPLNRYDDDAFGGIRGASTPETPRQIAKALFNFHAQNKREISFNKGDIVTIKRNVDKNWIEGEFKGLTGIFPSNYVEIIPLDSHKSWSKKSVEGQARVRFNFQAQTAMEMSLTKGEMIVLTRRVDDNWYEGRAGARKGIFPTTYVDALIEPGERQSSPSREPLPRPALPPAHLLFNGSSSVNSPYSTLGRPGSQNDTKSPFSQLTVNTQQDAIPYRALYNYKPQNDDELELHETDGVMVMEKCDDGWFVGTSQRTGLFGTFPGNYVERA